MKMMKRLLLVAKPMDVQLMRPLYLSALLMVAFCSTFSAAAQTYPPQQQEFVQTYEKCQTDLRAQSLEIVAKKIERECIDRLERIVSSGLNDWQGIAYIVSATESSAAIEIWSQSFRSPSNVILRGSGFKGNSPALDAEHESLVKQLVDLNLQPEQRVVFSATLAEPISFLGQQPNFLRLAVKGLRLRRR